MARFQTSLRFSLLIGMPGLCIALAIVGYWWRASVMELRAVEVLREHHAALLYTDMVQNDRVVPSEPSFLSALVDSRLGREFRSDVYKVEIYAEEADRPDARRAIIQLPGLRLLRIWYSEKHKERAEKLKRDLGPAISASIIVERSPWPEG